MQTLRQFMVLPVFTMGNLFPHPLHSSSVHKASIHLLDCMTNMEAMVVGFIAGHSLSLTMSNKLIALAKELCKDKATLKRLKMHQTTASCKLTYGLS